MLTSFFINKYFVWSSTRQFYFYSSQQNNLSMQAQIFNLFISINFYFAVGIRKPDLSRTGLVKCSSVVFSYFFLILILFDICC